MLTGKWRKRRQSPRPSSHSESDHDEGSSPLTRIISAIIKSLKLQLVRRILICFNFQPITRILWFYTQHSFSSHPITRLDVIKGNLNSHQSHRMRHIFFFFYTVNIFVIHLYIFIYSYVIVSFNLKCFGNVLSFCFWNKVKKNYKWFVCWMLTSSINKIV